MNELIEIAKECKKEGIDPMVVCAIINKQGTKIKSDKPSDASIKFLTDLGGEYKEGMTANAYHSFCYCKVILFEIKFPKSIIVYPLKRMTKLYFTLFKSLLPHTLL